MSSNEPAVGASTEKKKAKRLRGPGKPVAGLLLTAAGTARELGLSPKTARDYIEKGLIPARHLGGRVVVVRSELEQFIAGLPAIASVDGALGRLATLARAAGRS